MIQPPWRTAAAASLAALLSTACVTTPLPGVPVQAVEPAAVQSCTRVGELTINSMRDSGSPSADLDRAKEKLLSEARAQGATHLVITDRNLRGALAWMSGTMYRCG